MSPNAQSERPLRVIFLDHAGQLGGGQLGMLRYFQHPSAFERIAVFLTGGPIVDQVAAAGIETHLILDRADFDRRALLAGALKARRMILALRPDIVVATSAGAVKLLPLLQSRSFARIAYLREGLVHSSRGRLKSRVVTGGFYGNIDGYIANSAWTASTIPRRLRRVPCEISFPVSNVSDTLATARKRQFPETGEVRIASFSRPVAWKGVHILVEALSELSQRRPDRSFRLDVYGGDFFGTDRYTTSLRRRLDDAPFPATMHGHVDEVVERMAETDVLVLPSLTPEPFGQVVAQGLASGCVVVVSNHGGAIEQVNSGENGLTFEPGSSKDLAQVIEHLLDDPAAARGIQALARVRAAHFLDEVLVSNFDAAIETLIRTSPTFPVRVKELAM